MNRSLKFNLLEAGPLYDARLEVVGAITGAKFGTLSMTRADMKELRDLLDGQLAEDPTPMG